MFVLTAWRPFIDVSVPTSYTAVIEAMGAGQVDVAWLATFAHSPATAAAIDGIRPFADRREIEERLGQVEEIRSLARFGTGLPLAGFDRCDLHDALPFPLGVCKPWCLLRR